MALEHLGASFQRLTELASMARDAVDTVELQAAGGQRARLVETCHAHLKRRHGL